MMNAKEARERMTDVSQGRAKIELDAIEKLINKSVENAECLCHVGAIMPIVKEHLKSLGYKVSSYNDRNETCSTISW